MFEQAERHLADGPSVVIDGTFRSADERRLTIALGEEHYASVWMVECVLSPDVAQQRLNQRAESGGAISDGRWEIYQQQRREWEPVREVPEHRHLLLDTSGSLTENMGELIYRFNCNFYGDVI